ncbi:MAG TPA: alpha/beta hydrolase [Caulobacteraceae bacterium]|nr:alpha/beta hydrolase [Caulobacteraceae bacterium]
MKPSPIIMVHGGFCGGWAFDGFAAPFRAAGHSVVTPDLPGHEADGPSDAALGRSMTDYAKAIAEQARRVKAPPILIGHSMGGLVSLMASARAPVAGVILLAPSAPWGVGGSSMEEAISAVGLYALGPYWAQAIAPDYGSFRRYGVDRLPREARRAIFARMRPESGRALFETLNWWLDPFMTTMIHPEQVRAPVLALAGGRDVIHPPATVRETARRIGAAFELMPQMSHWLIGEPGWDEVAARCLDWADQLAVGVSAAAE